MKKILLLLMMLTASVITYAQQAEPVNLYPDGVPNRKPAPAVYREKPGDDGWVSLVTHPQLIPHFPAKDKANGTAVVICPGGGYSGLSMVNEGSNIAERFNELGITAFILKYRLPSDHIMADKSIGPLQDAQRAIQLVRQNAAQWHIDPTKVGIIGFSAGGHLASTAGTHFNKAVIANPGNISLRPDFMMLLYPVITFGPYAHQGSRDNLLGKNAPQDQIDLYSNEKQVTKDTPPTFIVHAQDDNVVPIQNALLFYEALNNDHVKSELHIYPAGGHGFGLHNHTTTDDWFERCKNWLVSGGWVK